MKKLLAFLAMFACTAAGVFGAAIPYPDRGTIAPTYTYTATTSGEEVAYFYASSAQYVDLIGLWDDGTQLGNFALNNHATTFGESVDFGHVNAGDTITFALQVVSKGYVVFSNPSMNADGINHVYTTPFAGQTNKGVTIPVGTFVSFEDLLLPHSDLNYNDEDVIFSDLTATPAGPSTPEPSSLLLLGVGLVGTGWQVARKKRS